METLGARLREIREAKGWSMNELANRSKMASSAITYFERDERKPSADALIRLSEALGVTVDHILGRPSTANYEDSTQLQIFHRNLSYLPVDKRESRLKMFNTIIQDEVSEYKDESDLR